MPLDISKRLVSKLTRIEAYESGVHLFAGRLYLGDNYFTMSTNMLFKCLDAGLLRETKDHWYELSPKGKRIIKQFPNFSNN